MPTHELVCLPYRREHPFRNMEEDLLLLYRNPRPDAVLLRHYGWKFPCWTCGYSQNFSYVREVTGGTVGTIFRRATGGGIVPHEADWTFTLVVGPEHPAFECHPRTFYDRVHTSIVEGLSNLGRTATLHACQEDVCNGAPPTECFKSPVLSDVLDSVTGTKLAGAAIKKTRDGVLLQGSVQKAEVPGLDWTAFQEHLEAALTTVFECVPAQAHWPFTPEDRHPPYGERIHCEAWLQG